jgi:hypothetical protein
MCPRARRVSPGKKNCEGKKGFIWESMQSAREPLLSSTERVIAQTQSLGSAILDSLHSQRQSLETSRSHQVAAVADLDASASAMRRARQRVLLKRAACIGVALLLLAAIIVTWWYKWGRHPVHDD